MTRLKNIAVRTLWVIAGLYLSLTVLLKVPAIQAFTGSMLGTMLEEKLGTKVSIGQVRLGLFNRVVVDDVSIDDKSGKQMLRLSRIAAKIDLLPLTEGKISVSSAQVFGMRAVLYKLSERAQPNFQFVIDSLSSKDDTGHTPLNLSIQSVVIRNGSVKYDIYDKPRTPGRFNVAHLDISDISSHVRLNTLTDDSISIYVKKLSLKEASGLQLKGLAFNAEANKSNARVKDFELLLPGTRLSIKEASASYMSEGGKPDMRSASFSVKVAPSEVTPADLSCFIGDLRSFKDKVSFGADLSGKGGSVIISSLSARSQGGEFSISGSGNVRDLGKTPRWNMHVSEFVMSDKDARFIASNLGNGKTVPGVATRAGNINFHGSLSGHGDFMACRGNVKTDAGNARLDAWLRGSDFKGEVSTDGIDMRRLLDDKDFGTIAADIRAEGRMAKGKKPIPLEHVTAKGTIRRVDYRSYSYRNISVDGTYRSGTFDGMLAMDDPNGKADIKGRVNVNGTPSATLNAVVRNLRPKALGLTDKTGDRSFSFAMKVDAKGDSPQTMDGTISVENFEMRDGTAVNRIETLLASAGHEDGRHFIDITSDFGTAEINGKFDYKSIVQSLAGVIGDKLPTLPGLPRTASTGLNMFDMDIRVNDLGWLKGFLGIPLELHAPATLYGTIDDSRHAADMTLDAPAFSYGGRTFKGTHVAITTRNDTLYAAVRADKDDDGKSHLSVTADMKAAGNKLVTDVGMQVNGSSPLQGRLNAVTDFYSAPDGKPAAHVVIGKSEVSIGKTLLEIQPSEIIYSDYALTINDFKISNNRQHLTINGCVTKNRNDSISVDMQNIDVGYMLDLVNFRSVEFSGRASGRATIKSLFSAPEAMATLNVDDFRFEGGQMGTLHAMVGYDTENRQIDIDAVADDGPDARTLINGYVSPARNYIDLGIRAEGTRLEFLEGFCGSFMDNVKARGNGHCRLFGDLKTVNLEGMMVANGSIDIKSLNTTYTLRNDTITMVPDEIVFKNDTIYDAYGNKGTVSGSLHHKHLTRMTFDIGIKADNLLAYDFHDYGDDVFYGTVFATGTCDIVGRPGEITMNIEATPGKGSFIEYNAASPEGISDSEFITWNDATPRTVEEKDSVDTADEDATEDEETPSRRFPEIPSDVKLNFIVNATPDFTLRVLMDRRTGDYIALNGYGGIRAYYFNKGAFEMFGNYLVEDGVYKLTIQNIIKKEFRFQQGSSITFGGDPFGAVLNLKGVYALNAVSLSDLQIGRSFKSNNIKVNCLMDITGTAGQPNVTFDLDLPTLSADAQQMVRSVINSEEDMNQQVLYLLAVGRFYTQGSNNAAQDDAEAQSQTSLAMQSLLSGTISQQINSVLSNVVKSSNWNFGANISTGDDGWNNAEYEGLLSGSLLNNRLLINGQFGYRDKVNTTEGSSFIGDFDIRYLLFPSGNLAIKVYNQTNDRYFTRNSLNTQGIGLIMKKDFDRLGDIFGKKKKKKKDAKGKDKR